MSGRYLGIDLGTRRIGLAIGGPDAGVVSPLRVLDAQPTAAANARLILAAADEYDVDGVVIGLPLNMDGTEGPQAKHSKTLAAHLRQLQPSDAAASGGRRKPLEIHLHDERLTSYAADQQLAGRELTRKKKKARQDALAAAAILRGFFELTGR